jgi:predicted GNAT family acetyltransferase
VTDDARIVVTDAPERKRFEVTVDSELAGSLVYRVKGGLLALIHTEVDVRFESHGLGGRLARFALDQAHERHLAVLPFCPFVNDWMKRHREYVDLVPAEYRSNFDL